MVAHLGGADGRGFIGGDDFSAALARQADAADRAGINNAPAAGGGGGLDDVARAFHVGGVHRRVIAQPQVIAGGDVKAPVAPAHRFLQQVAPRQVAGRGLVIGALQAAQIAAGAQEGLDAMAAGGQFLHQIGSDKPRRACDKTIHRLNDRVVLKKTKTQSFFFDPAKCK